MSAAQGTIRVLVVDDSAFMRRLITQMLQEGGGFEVVGTARDGLEAVRLLEELKPDVVTLDVEMPRMGGLETLGYIMSERPTPVVMLSAYTPRGAELTLKALEYGAADFVQKPSGAISLDLERVKAELVAKIRAAHSINLKLLDFRGGEPERRPRPKAAAQPALEPLAPSGAAGAAWRAVLVASSTGGPRALAEVIPRLPAGLDAAVLIVQHMSPGFTKSLAARLDQAGRLRVKEAENGDLLRHGQAYLAPGDWHMEVESSPTGPRIALNQRPPMLGVRPAADPLFASAAKVFGKGVVAAVLTGMGHDGTKGMKAVRAAGGLGLAQDEASCVVYGMPRNVVEAGLAETVALDRMAAAICERLGG